MPDETTPPRPGLCTTGFWQSLMVTGVGLYLVVRGSLATPPNEIAMTIGALMAGVTSVGYAGIRTLAKKQQP